MIKWEYKRTAPIEDDRLNALGAEGWELVALMGGGYIFKRDAAIGVEMEAETRYGN